MILAMDLGSTAFKAAVFDRNLQRVGSGACALRYDYRPGGVVELNPAHVLDAVRTAVKAATTGIDLTGLAAIAITSQAQTFTVTDAEFRPLIPFISWLDTRAAGTCKTVAATGAWADFGRHVSFPELLPAMQLCQLVHLQATQPELLRDGRRALPLPCYLVAMLSGDAVCDTNLAAMSGLYFMQLNEWWPDALAACGLAKNALPALVDAGAVAGHTTERAVAVGLPAGIPIVLTGNDQTAGAYGAGVHERDAVLIALGTCQVAYRAPAEPPAPDRTVAVGPYPGDAWYAMAADVCGGSLINWGQGILAGCETDDKFFAAAAAAPSGWNNLRFEIGADGNCNAWRHLTTGHTPGDMARSIVETLVRRMAGLVDTLCAGSKPDTFLLAGGGSQSTLWTTLLAEALSRPLIPTSADPLTGAARISRFQINQQGDQT
ncbi:MAG: hypothetical protein HQ581_07995 [Planctomycetes bacterium]|nr:hypothetical protein [Planctomycetota bacterium]